MPESSLVTLAMYQSRRYAKLEASAISLARDVMFGGEVDRSSGPTPSIGVTMPDGKRHVYVATDEAWLDDVERRASEILDVAIDRARTRS